MLPHVSAVRGYGVAVCVLCVVAGSAASAQTPDPASQPSSTLATPAPAATPTATGTPPVDLRSRTRDFEPTRFNLSARGGLGLISAVSPYTLARWEVGSSASVMNFDRNPGDIDFFEYGIQLAV